MVNKFSASASEILAGAIQDYDRGLVVGTSTFGKGTVQKVDLLSSGQIKYTESKFYRVSGSSTQNLGVEPDINLPTLFNIDEFLRKVPSIEPWITIRFQGQLLKTSIGSVILRTY